MTKNLNLIEEIEYREKFSSPFLSYISNSLTEKKRIVSDLLMRKSEEILLIDKWGFNIDSIFAGLNEKHIEYFAKHAPLEYRKSLLEIFKDQEMINSVWEITKAMDNDEGNGSMQNQNRIKNVIQYIKDSRVVFLS